MSKISSGLIMYRERHGKTEVFLVHPGGPFWKNKDNGAWSIPKGEVEEGETNLLEVAKREFEEETGIKVSTMADDAFIELGTVERPGKVVHVWAFEGDTDPSQVKSNIIEIDWPPKSDKKMQIPEVDRAAFFNLEEAGVKLNKYQAPILERLKKIIAQKI